MVDLLLYLFLIATITFEGMLTKDCPVSNLLKPCICKYGNIACANVTGAHLKEIFTKLDKLDDEVKQFQMLTITGPGCDLILESTFSHINFDIIMILDAPNLNSIHTNAFQNTRTVVIYLVLQNLPSLDVSNLFDAINKCEKLRYLHLLNLAKLEEIPSLAFEALEMFKILKIAGNNIKKINEKPFYNLNSLIRLDFVNTSIDSIGGHIFEFSRGSERRLTIGFYNNPDLNCDSFIAQTFSEANRPLKLSFNRFDYPMNNNSQQLTCMSEAVFRPFFEADPNNFVDINGNDFDCNNCESFWIKNETRLLNRIHNLTCENKNNFTNDTNFYGC